MRRAPEWMKYEKSCFPSNAGEFPTGQKPANFQLLTTVNNFPCCECWIWRFYKSQHVGKVDQFRHNWIWVGLVELTFDSASVYSVSCESPEMKPCFGLSLQSGVQFIAAVDTVRFASWCILAPVFNLFISGNFHPHHNHHSHLSGMEKRKTNSHWSGIFECADGMRSCHRCHNGKF